MIKSIYGYLKGAIGWAIPQAFLALACFILYQYNLKEVFDIELDYLQWVSIVIICNFLIPRGIVESNKDTATKPFNKYFNQHFKNEQ